MQSTKGKITCSYLPFAMLYFIKTFDREKHGSRNFHSQNRKLRSLSFHAQYGRAAKNWLLKVLHGQ